LISNLTSTVIWLSTTADRGDIVRMTTERGSSSSAEPWTVRFRGLRALEVLRVSDLTPRMRRITLGGPEAVGIPTGLGPNLKLVIPPPGIARPAWPLHG